MTSLFRNTATVGGESPRSLSGLRSSKPSSSGSVRSSTSSSGTGLVDGCDDLPDLNHWLDAITQQSGAAKSTIMVALVYVERIQSRLPQGVVRLPSTAYRLLLAGLIVAAKMTHDRSLKNSIWAKYSDIFDTDDVNLMEAQLLQLIDYHLVVSEEELLATCSSLLYGTPPATLRRPASSLTLGSSLPHLVSYESDVAPPRNQQPASAMSESNLHQAQVQDALLVRAKQMAVRQRMRRTASIHEQPVPPSPSTWEDSCIAVDGSHDVRTLRSSKTPPSKSSNNTLSRTTSFWDTDNRFSSSEVTSTTTTPTRNEPSARLDMKSGSTPTSPLKHIKVDSTSFAADMPSQEYGSAKPLPLDQSSHPFPSKARNSSATTATSSPESNITPTTPRVSFGDRPRLHSASSSGARQSHARQIARQQASPVPLLLHQPEYDGTGRQASFTPLNTDSPVRRASDDNLISGCLPRGTRLKSAQSMPHIGSSSSSASFHATPLLSATRVNFKRPSVTVRVKADSTDSSLRRPSWASIRLLRKKSTASSFFNIFADRAEGQLGAEPMTPRLAPHPKPGIAHKGSAPVLRQTYQADQPNPIPVAGVPAPSTAQEPPAGRGLRARASALKLRTTNRLRSLVSISGS